MKLLVCDPTSSRAIDAMREAGIEVDVRDDITAEELEGAIAGYEAIVVRSRTKVRGPLIDAATGLKLIIRAGVGLDNVDVEYARSKGVEVCNTPAASSNSVAELTIGYLFALARRIPQATASMRAGKWEKKAFGKGSELAGKTLGVIGAGRIGQLVAQKAAALGMAVIGSDPYVTKVAGVEMVPLNELLTRSDYITLHLPHIPETHHLIGAPQFALMKEGVRVVNCARGGVVDEAALYEAIGGGRVAGAALDVFEDEKEERGRRLMELPQVIGSPHVGAGTVEASARVGEEVVQIAITFANR
jgi:D-3-phosphoglycerate dehydrogenase